MEAKQIKIITGIHISGSNDKKAIQITVTITKN